MRLFRLAATLAVLAAGLITIDVSTASHPAGANTSFTALNEQFTEATFPPANWQTPYGTWTSDCALTSPMTGCAATDTVTDGALGVTELLYNPPAGLPANLQNATLSFYSDFTPDATTSGDAVSAGQASAPGDTGDFSPVSVIEDAFGPPPGAGSSDDPYGTPVLHTVALQDLNVPIAFRWSAYGDSSATASETWSISNVTITGTLPATPYALTANPIVNTAYPHIVAGQPITLRLSGSSDPTGDSLDFNVTTPPTLGHLGTITQVDDTHATVVYTPNALACPDPDGFSGMLCPDSFKFTVSDVEGNVSSAANVDLDVLPGGADGQVPILSVPPHDSYVTLSQGGQMVQAVDLSGSVTVGPTAFPDPMEIQMLASSGTMELLNAVQSGATFLNGTASGDQQIYLQGSASQLNTALGEFLYFPPAGTTPTSTITIYAWDLGATGTGPHTSQTEAVSTVDGIVSNPPPTISLPTGALGIATNAGPLGFPSGTSTGISVTDVAASATTHDQVDLSVSGGSLALPAADSSGTTALVTAQSLGSGSTLDLTGSVAHLNLALLDLTFDPTGLFSGPVTLSASVSDPDTQEASPPASATITVTEAPYAFGSTAVSILENEPAVIYLCGSGPQGDSLTFQITAAPQQGTLVLDSAVTDAESGCSPTTNVVAYLYTPTNGYIGTDSFSYRVTDLTTGLVSDLNAVTITVGSHQKPTAYDVAAATNEDQAVALTLCGENPDPDPKPTLTFSITEAPIFGTLSQTSTPRINPCNRGNVPMNFTYTPKPGTFTTDGTDHFEYIVSNGTTSDPASGTITVATLTPQVSAESASVNEDGSIQLYLCATDPSIQPLTFSLFGQTHGTVDDQGEGASTGPVCPGSLLPFDQVDYTPTPLYSGPDQLVYSVSDGAYTSALTLISITVVKIELPPTSTAQTVTDFWPHSVAITLAGASLQGSSLAFRVTSGPHDGTLTGTAPNLIYTPSTDSGGDIFSFVANDGVADSAASTVTINMVTPQLASSVCTLGPEISLDRYTCGNSLTPTTNATGQTFDLAHTNGNRASELQLQAVITNETPVPDTVTITGPAAPADWTLFYEYEGYDITSAMTTTGYTVTLGADGVADIIIVAFSPLNLPDYAGGNSMALTLTATSGNDSTVSTSLPVVIADGTNKPTLSLTQADGTGASLFPATFELTPNLYDGGPSGTALIDVGLAGTGDNSFQIHADGNQTSGPGVTAQYFLGTTDVTAAVLAGTEVIECYAVIGCPPMKVVLTPTSTAGVASTYYTIISATSTVDGATQSQFLYAPLAGAVGPDLVTYGPTLGAGVFEATPSTQVVSSPTEVSGTSTKDVYLTNVGDLPDTFAINAAVTKVSGDSGQISVGATPAGDLDRDDVVDQTAAITQGSFRVTLGAGAGTVLSVTDHAGASAPSTPPSVVLTATSQTESSKVDSFEVTFPSYSYRPDAMLTASNGQVIGAGVYQQTYQGPNGNSQQEFYDIDQAPTAITVTLTDRGNGQPAVPDAVVVTAPVTNYNFNITYALNQNGTTTDVTSALEGAGLDLALGNAADGAPEPTITMTAVSSQGALAGYPAYFPLTVSSLSTLPASLADTVVINLYNSGQSQLRFGGLPQPEPSDITQYVNEFHITNRVAPFPSVGYVPGAYYGAYPDATGQKFAYVSAWDTFDLQVAAHKVSPTAYRVQMVDPGRSGTGLPSWENILSFPYYNGNKFETPADAMSLDPTIMAGGVNVTAAVENGTYTTAALGTDQTSIITISFNPPAGDSQRYTPLKFNLINAQTGQIEDVMVIDPSSIITCTTEDDVQQQAMVQGSDGNEHLNFEAFNRQNPNAANDCFEQLSHSWITTAPVVFSSYVPATDTTPAGGESPEGLWLVPQNGSMLRINSDTLAVTGSSVESFVDSPLLNADGSEDTAATAQGYLHYYFLGDYLNLDWLTADGTNGLEVNSTSTTLPASPFPLVAPDKADWPNSTMSANRYFQVDTETGAPVMVGEMNVDVPWYDQDVPLVMDVDSVRGLTLDYAILTDTAASLPGMSSVSFYNFYWTTNNDGTVVQGGCLGVPGELFTYLGLGSGPSECVLGATVTFQPISTTAGVEAKVSQVTVQLINPGIGVKGSPEFNLSGLTGEIDFDPTTEDATKIVLDPNFGIGPPTPCQLSQNNGEVTGVLSNIAYLPCPTNYFFFNAKLTFQQGGFNDNPTTGFGIQFSGTLTFLNVITLANVEADISSDPFNFHFADSPIDLSISIGVPITASLTFSGDVGATGFDISMGGAVEVDGFTLASASGILSTKGMGVCGGVAGISMGFGYDWGDSPQFDVSGCTTSQYQVGT